FSSLMDDNDKKKKPSEIALRIIAEAGFREELESDDSMESRNRLENLEEFVDALGDYESSADSPSLEEYLNNISLLTSEENTKELTDFVTLMTVHNSKGLEFEYVYLTGMEEGTFPHFMSSDSPGELEEERRLCYVAITRARKKLFISHSRFTRRFGSVEPRIPSRFLDEMPEDAFDPDADIFRRTEKFPVSAPAAENRRENEALDSRQRTIGKPELSGIRNGSTVKHRDYGIGRVIDITGSGDNIKVKVGFGNIHKNFLLAYTPLELVK
ncbi:MAG: ATP-binding domain-containing protein, partial [Leptospira sp.]|nr:ATP-binding domain-containing protein [Leptospira sp.]